ncbi:MAG: FtsQ-type POTRA domain-containing protein [Desulfotomaculaceae bacterium]|nr:FtsQ-type POTRA domain-containing protein [Desulfotomaculaceae bacterium]
MTNLIGNNKTRKKWNIYESIFWVLIFLMTGFILLRSPLFEVRQVLVSGNQFLLEEKIRTVAGIGIGINIFKLNLTAVEENLRLMPMIKEVQVTRALPATVQITIKERRPLGLLSTGEGFIEVDEEGVCLQKAGVSTPGLPVITGASVEQSTPGEVVKAERLDDALTVISSLPDDALSILSEVHVDLDHQIKVYTMEGFQCRLGQATEIAEKGALLALVLQEIKKQGAKVDYIDLSCAGMPVVKYKDSK